MQDTKQKIAKSRGHLGFSVDKKFEYYERAGEVFIAPIHNAFDIDDYRHGRWECSRTHFDRYCDLYSLETNKRRKKND